MALFLVWLLKAFGVLWAIGGIFAIHQTWKEIFLDQAIERAEELLRQVEETVGEASLSEDHDRGRTYWLMVGGALTVVSGVGLIVSHRYVLVPLTLLVIHQAIYAWRQSRLVARATSQEMAEEAAMSPEARNGAIVAVGVWLLTLSLVWTGAFS